MDRAVIAAYGWTDVAPECDFFLDYDIDEATWGRKKKPYRYRWPDAVHDDVLARLLALNQQRHQEDVLAGRHTKLARTLAATSAASSAAPSAASSAASSAAPAATAAKPGARKPARKPATPRKAKPAATATLSLFDRDEPDDP